MKLCEEKDQWVFQLDNARVNYIHIDFRLTLDVVDESEKAAITIETPCKLTACNSESLLIPEKASTLAPILPLFNAKVVKITMQKNGYLIVEFADGGFLKVDPDESYEAWQVAWLAHYLLICSPGGKVSFFKQPTP